jgi:hypothetical protein
MRVYAFSQNIKLLQPGRTAGMFQLERVSAEGLQFQLPSSDLPPVLDAGIH